MSKIVLLGTLALTSLVLTASKPSPWFSGRIIYRNELQNAAGEAPANNIGPESWFYFQGNNYKLYRQDRKLRELYVGKTHLLQAFKDGKTITFADTAKRPVPLVIEHLPATATILGHPCQAVQLVRGQLASLVYFSAELRVDAQGFRQYPGGYWYALLQATKGGLPLRTITIDSEKGYTLTIEATSVQPMLLDDRDFTATAPAE